MGRPENVSSRVSSESAARRQRDYAIVVSARGFAFFAFFVVVTLLAVMVVHRATQVFAVLGAATTAAVIAVPFVRALSSWMPRAAALVIVTLIGMFGTVAVLGIIAWDLDHQAAALSASLHHA